MNILPKKSWHVRNKDNVAKVRKDEEEARQLEKKRLHQVALAEQEARTELLRKKARKSKNEEDLKVVDASSSRPEQPINFFQEVGPDGKPYSSSAKNIEHEEEKQVEKEKQEKKIGLLTYLGQSAVETMPDEERPWYFKPPSRKNKSNPEKMPSKYDIVDAKRKASLDPLASMKESLHKKKKHTDHKKKHKHKKTKTVVEGLPSEDKLAKLRKARLEREAHEKQRSKELLSKHYGIPTSEASTSGSTSSCYVQKYSNQFNPHLARNNKL